MRTRVRRWSDSLRIIVVRYARGVSAKTRLSASMTLDEFDNGYWYALELAEFAESIGVPSARKLRKDEIERAVRIFLRTGKIESPTRRALTKSGIKDVDKGLTL